MKLLRTLAAVSLFALGGVVMAQTGGVLSPRLIVKYKASPAMAGMSAQQIQAQLRQPLTAASVQSLSASAGMTMSYARATALSSHVLQLPAGATRADVQKAIQSLKQRTDIEYVEEDVILKPLAVPNDTLYNTLWGMQPVNVTGNKYGADFQTAWDSVTGSGVVVAVVDTGILPHPDLVGTGGTVSPATGNLVSPGYDFTSDCRIRNTCPASQTANTTVAPAPNAFDMGDWVTTADTANSFFANCTVKNSSWHGTHVAGTIAALGNNSSGVIGGAYNAKILPVRALGKCGGFGSDITDGVLWAAGLHPTIANPNPAKVINMSLGGLGACSTTQQQAFDKLYAAGVVVVVAAGNNNVGVDGFQPANCNNVITIAATGPTGTRAYYSNYDALATTKYIALAAQGGAQGFQGDPNGINSTLSSATTTYTPGSDNYVYYQGTSMATPHAAAAVALMLSKNPTLTPAQVRAVLTSNSSLTAFPTGTGACTTAQCGAGILNAKLAVQNANNMLSPSATTLDFGVKAVGTTTDQALTLTNGSAVLSAIVNAATLSGTGAAAYQIVSDSCSAKTIATNGTCSLTVRYTPASAGSGVASLTLPTANGSTIVALTAWAGSKLTVDTATKAVPSLVVGSSATVTSTFTNATTGNLTLASPTLGSTIMAVSTDTCSNKTLAAGANCSVAVTVSPTAAGNYSGTLRLNTSGGTDIAQVVTISGVATGSSTPTPTPAPTTGSGGGGGGGCTMLPPGESQGSSDLSLALYAALAGLTLVLRARQRRQRG